MLLHHFGDDVGNGLLLQCQTFIEAHTKLLLQEVDDEFGAIHLLLVVLDPWHLSLWGELPIKVVLHEKGEQGGKNIII